MAGVINKIFLIKISVEFNFFGRYIFEIYKV